MSEIQNFEVPPSPNRKMRIARQAGVYACMGANIMLAERGVDAGFTPETIGGMAASGVVGTALLGKEHVKAVLGIGQGNASEVTQSQSAGGDVTAQQAIQNTQTPNTAQLPQSPEQN